MQKRTFVYLAVGLVVGAAFMLGLWRPWQTGGERVGTEESDPPVDAAAVRIIKESGHACEITILGTAGNARNSSSASLAAGRAQTASIRFPAPYTIEAVTVTRDGNERRQQLKLTLAGGQQYELLINRDNTVAVASARR